MSRLFILLFLVMGCAWFGLYFKRGSMKKSAFEATRHFLVVLLIGVMAIGLMTIILSTFIGAIQ